MRVSFSGGHLFRSPLVAFFCCCLIPPSSAMAPRSRTPAACPPPCPAHQGQDGDPDGDSPTSAESVSRAALDSPLQGHRGEGRFQEEVGATDRSRQRQGRGSSRDGLHEDRGREIVRGHSEQESLGGHKEQESVQRNSGEERAQGHIRHGGLRQHRGEDSSHDSGGHDSSQQYTGQDSSHNHGVDASFHQHRGQYVPQGYGGQDSLRVYREGDSSKRHEERSQGKTEASGQVSSSLSLLSVQVGLFLPVFPSTTVALSAAQRKLRSDSRSQWTLNQRIKETQNSNTHTLKQTVVPTCTRTIFPKHDQNTFVGSAGSNAMGSIWNLYNGDILGASSEANLTNVINAHLHRPKSVDPHELRDRNYAEGGLLRRVDDRKVSHYATDAFVTRERDITENVIVNTVSNIFDSVNTRHGPTSQTISTVHVEDVTKNTDHTENSRDRRHIAVSKRLSAGTTTLHGKPDLTGSSRLHFKSRPTVVGDRLYSRSTHRATRSTLAGSDDEVTENRVHSYSDKNVFSKNVRPSTIINDDIGPKDEDILGLESRLYSRSPLRAKRDTVVGTADTPSSWSTPRRGHPDSPPVGGRRWADSSCPLGHCQFSSLTPPALRTHRSKKSSGASNPGQLGPQTRSVGQKDLGSKASGVVYDRELSSKTRSASHRELWSNTRGVRQRRLGSTTQSVAHGDLESISSTSVHLQDSKTGTSGKNTISSVLPSGDDNPSASLPPKQAGADKDTHGSSEAPPGGDDVAVDFGRAAYFSGREVLRLNPPALVSPGTRLPDKAFTVDLWLKPEGGQYDPAAVVAMSDTCGTFSTGGHWALGIGTYPGSGGSTPGEARYQFWLKTTRAAQTSTVTAHRRYVPSVWTHVAASYDGRRMALYVNGALVAVGWGQSREIFSPSETPCKVVTLGGLPSSAASALRPGHPLGAGPPPHPHPRAASSRFRGSVGVVRLWARALPPRLLACLLRTSTNSVTGLAARRYTLSPPQAPASPGDSQPGADSIHPKADNIHPKADNIHPKADNIHPKADNIHPKADNIHPKADNIHPKADNIHPMADNIHPKADNIHPMADVLSGADNSRSSSAGLHSNINIHSIGDNIHSLGDNTHSLGDSTCNTTQDSIRLDPYVRRDNSGSRWTVEEGRHSPAMVPETDLSPPAYDLSIPVPRCGQTVCDNPDVVLSYVDHWQLRAPKLVRYRIVNLMNDDGSNPTVSDQQILQQHEALARAFRGYNISFLLHVHKVRNSTLRQRLVMFGCHVDQVGDGLCNHECMHTQTGLDGGDCDTEPAPCDASRRGDGRCDLQCNKRYHHWDDGDCCRPGNDTHYTCYDPQSPHRAYVTVDELRQVVGLRSDTHLNVFIAVCSDWSTRQPRAPHLIGLATFPWEKHVYSVQGGTVIQHQTFGTAGQMDSLVHEVGHNLGLWHVHHGVTEVDCADPCAETEASMELGDLCADTAPTPANVHCQDPDRGQDHCGLPATFSHTPYSNYMSYADDTCTDHFTPQQVGRMHCYLDLAYQPWRVAPSPSPVALPPTVVAAEPQSVTVAWTEPLGHSAARMRSVCGLCDHQGSLLQFAHAASSPTPTTDTLRWTPHQATGPPDAEPCVPSIKAWLPEVTLCTKRTPCRLDLVLKIPVVIHTLTLWVTWNAEGVRKVKLVFEDGGSSVLKATPAFCDVPFTATLSSTRRVRKIQVFTRTPFTAIDALQVVSLPGHEQCQSCRPPTYRVFRLPPARGRSFRTANTASFTDREVDAGVSYQYWVDVLWGRASSQPSPRLLYTHGHTFCGDGSVDRSDGEECDDGNLLPGDGCDVKCKMEDTFHCKGSPSACYRHSGDGVCEDFERRVSVVDCGYFTPQGALDQWAHAATANPQHQLPHCPPAVATGPPDIHHCGPVVDPRTAWFPCGSQVETGNFWIKLFVPRPVVAAEVIVHVASDGRTEADPAPKAVSVELVKEDRSAVLLTPSPVVLDCTRPQLHVPVVHNLTTPFYRSTGVRLSFDSHNISIAAVRVRSYRYLDPVTLASCGLEETFNPHTGLCLTQDCNRRSCGPAEVVHGKMACTGRAEGDVCTVTCHQGYTPESRTMKLRCRGGHWVSDQSVGCLPVDCGRPTLAWAVLSCVDGTSLGHNCTFHCQPPSSLHGFDNVILCEEDGLWSTPRAHCLVTCPPPLHVPHVTRLKKRCRSGSLLVGSRCKMRCKRGYRVADARRPGRRVFRLTCDADGTWSGGRCERVTCPKFDPVFTGLLTCTDDVSVGSRCTLLCPRSDEAQMVTCGSDGRWNSPLLRCPHFDLVTCPYPDVTTLTLRCSPPVVGAQCSVTCAAPDEVAVFDLTFTPEGRAGLTGEVVNSVTCTGRGQWFPPLDRVACVQKCNTEFIGDTWCDARNNQQYCQWDGGDCCPSTLGAPVRPFPHDCGHGCSCADPRASENTGRSGGQGG